MKPIQPALADDAFLADVAAARHEPGFRLWWLGQSGYLIQWEGRHLVLDPYLSDTLTRKYAETDKPHIRMSARVVAPDRLDFIDAATSSHTHTDHLDAETLGALRRVNPALLLVIPEANRSFVAGRLGCDASWPLGLVAGASVDAAGFRFHAVPAAHNDLDTDAEGRHRYLGYVVTFGPFTVYHSGDTLWYEGLTDWLAPWKPDVALLPINGNRPGRRVAGNLDGREAAMLAHRIGAGLVIPGHYDLFTFNTAAPEAAFVPECERLGQPYAVLAMGERWSSG